MSKDKRPHLLENLNVEEMSLVDRGGNQHADIIFQKSECDKMETNERVAFLARLAKFFNVGEQDGDKLIIKTEEDTVSGNEEKLQKTVDEQAGIIIKMQAKDESRDALSKALTAISKAETADAVDQAVATFKSDTDTIKTEKKLDAADAVAKFIDGLVSGEVADAATARKAAIEKSNLDAEDEEFAKALPEKMRDDYRKMPEKERKEMRKRFNTGAADDDPVMKKLNDQETENTQLKKRLEDVENERALEKAIDEFSDLKGFTDVEKFAQRYLKIKKHDAEAAEEMVTEARAMRKQAGANMTLFRSIGKHGDGPAAGSAEEKLEKIAKGFRDADSTLSEEAAFAKATEENPKLYSDYLDECA